MKKDPSRQEWAYLNPDGTVAGRKVRTEPKAFHWLPSHPHILYRLPEALDVAAKGLLLFCEGEKDVHTAVDLGYAATTAGSASFGGTDLSPLEGKRIVVIQDNDPAGTQMAQRLADHLGSVECVVWPEDRPKGWDLTDEGGWEHLQLTSLTAREIFKPVTKHEVVNEGELIDLGSHFVRGRNGQFHCPTHEDKRTSLSITEKEDRWLVHCHALCDTRDVLAAVGLEMKDLYRRKTTEVFYTEKKRETIECFAVAVGYVDSNTPGGIMRLNCKTLKCDNCGPAIQEVIFRSVEGLEYMTITEDLIRNKAEEWSQFPIEGGRLYLSDVALNEASMPFDPVVVSELLAEWRLDTSKRRASFSPGITQAKNEALADCSLLPNTKRINREQSADREWFIFEEAPSREDVVEAAEAAGVTVSDERLPDGVIHHLEGGDQYHLMYLLGGWSSSVMRVMAKIEEVVEPEWVDPPLQSSQLPIPF